MDKHVYQFALILIILYSNRAHSQNIGEELQQERLCQIYDTCNSCIQGEPYCAWCYQQGFKYDRCGPASSLGNRGCSERYIYSSDDNSTITTTDSDKSFNDVTNPDKMEESVQIKPQQISVNLLPKQPLHFQFKYRLAKDYPLDLYYLMDLTFTMEPDVQTMANLGKEITDVLRNLTKNFKVAYGYYSDKVAMPFSKTTPRLVENPCGDGEGGSGGNQCRKAFDFIHALSFTNNVDEFIEKVNSSKTTANLDNLEGGFDALYQIILCETQIQWRKNSRKIIVVATDGTLHSAGDGILAGAVKRNVDGCFLDENGVYQKSLIYDYPSLEEVYHKLLKHKMNVLFAVKEDALKYYENLNKVIPTVSYVGKLAEKSTNVLNLVKEGYFNVIKNVKFSAHSSENIRVTFHADCNNNGDWNISNMCDNVEEGKEYAFNVTLELKQMPKNTEKETIVIEEQNIAEKLVIDVQYVGNCKCDDQEFKNACSNHGTFHCGGCECEEGWKGENCEISCMDQRFEECRDKSESYISSTCYGRGDCDCGKCICDEPFTGKYCQIKQCPKNTFGEVCSGVSNGICQDGTCNCTKSFSGADCSCSTSQTTCKAPGSDEICNGKGYCECGKCQCLSDYNGNFCEKCPKCTELCATYEKCVLDTLAKNNTEGCSAENENIQFIPKLLNHSITVDDITVCYVRREKDDGQICDTQFKYTIHKNLSVELEIYDVCGQPVQAGALIGIIIGVILGGGILLILVWKAKLMNDDKREYAKFQQNLRHSKILEENPLYNSPIRTYEMPVELQQFRSNSGT